MAVSKSKKKSNNHDDLDILQSDVASFASSLGLSSSLPSSGFNDVDFRKPDPLKPLKPDRKPKKSPSAHSTKTENTRDRNFKSNQTPKPKPPILSLDDSTDRNLGFDRFKNLPKLPLMKASSLGIWYEVAAELESKAVGDEKRAESKNQEEWNGFVTKKKDLAERLMAQYAKDYESSRGQNGDIKMVYTSMRATMGRKRKSELIQLINWFINFLDLLNLLARLLTKLLTINLSNYTSN